MMYKESAPQYQWELLAANVTDLRGIKRFKLLSQFSLTTVSNEIGIKMLFTAHQLPSPPLFGKIYVYICICRTSLGPVMTVHKVLALYLSQYFIIVISYYFHKLHSLVNANVRVYRLWPSTLLAWSHMESLPDSNVKNNRINSPAQLIVKCLAVNCWT